VEFTNEFQVPVDVDTAFATLIDLERVAPCMPGAQLEEVDGDTYTGRVKVKVGPMQVTYRGTAEVVEIDHDAKRAAIKAAGKEARGAGTASADVVATLRSDGDDTTTVTVVTDLAVTGKPAQFGRGVMADVGARIIDTFAERLEAMLQEEGVVGEEAPPPAAAEGAPSPDAAADTTTTAAEETPAEPAVPREATAPAGPGPEAIATGAAAAGPRRIAPIPGREDDALDLLDVAGPATLKRLVPLVAALLAVLGLIWWWRRR
jgi:uncharacterized protein